MKEFMEEYGGVIVTCMLGIMLLGLFVFAACFRRSAA